MPQRVTAKVEDLRAQADRLSGIKDTVQVKLDKYIQK